VKRVAGYGAVNKLNRTNLDDTMTVERVKAGCLGIDDNVTHGGAVGCDAFVKAAPLPYVSRLT